MIRLARAICLLAVLCLSPLAWGQASYWSVVEASDSYWTLQESSGNMADSVGSVTLSESGTLTYGAGGPTPWLPNSIETPGNSAGYATAASPAGRVAVPFSAWGWIRPTANGFRTVLGRRSANTYEYNLRINNNGPMSILTTNGSTNSSYTPSASEWSFVGVSVTADEVLFYHNGSSETIAATRTITDQNVPLGIGDTESNAHAGVRVAGVGLRSSAMTAGAFGELYAGPEPTYTASASLGTDGTFDAGEWDAYSNGTISFEWVAALADGTVVDSGTGGSGTADLSGVDPETMVYLLVRATNDGGYDLGDFGDRTSGYGSANDGYYEVASVETEASGPPPNPIGRTRWPWWLRRSEITKPKHYAARIELLGDSLCIAA